MRANLASRPSIADVRNAVFYDDATYTLRWRVTSGRALEGNEAGYLDISTGYYRVRIKGQLILFHHVVWAIEHGYWPERVDHINGCKWDNRACNLRECSQSENMANQGIAAHNTSGFKGVHWSKAANKWVAQIRVRGKNDHLGVFETKELASAAYEKAAKEAFGEFARTENFAPTPPPRIKAPKRPDGELTAEEAWVHFTYDMATGEIRWKKALGFRGAVGEIAGRLTHDGYIRIGIFKRQYMAHRIAYLMVCGEWPKLVIDHADGNRSNNKWSNLIECSQSANVKSGYARAKTMGDTRPIYKNRY